MTHYSCKAFKLQQLTSGMTEITMLP